MKIAWTEDDLEVEKLESKPSSDFECGRAEQTDYFVKHAWEDQSIGLAVTYVLSYKSQVAGYVTVTMDEIPLSKTERSEEIRFSRVPAMKLAQRGVDKKFEGAGFGKYLVTFAITIATLVKEQVGCRYVTLDAKTDLVEWYQSQGFVRNERDQEDRIEILSKATVRRSEIDRRLTVLPVSMRFDLQNFSSDSSERLPE